MIKMGIEEDQWVYFIVENPEAAPQAVGLTDSSGDLTFVPIFLEKETAQKGMSGFPTTAGKIYEVQAILFEDVKRYASEKGFLVYLLDEEGRVLDRIIPNPQ